MFNDLGVNLIIFVIVIAVSKKKNSKYLKGY